MSTLVIPDAACLLLLDNALNGASLEDLSLKLYTNNVAPTKSSTAASFTEATFAGYSPVSLTQSNWTIAIVSAVPTATYNATATFTCSSGSQVIVGAFVVGATSGSIYFAWKFDQSRTITPGNSLSITPQLTGVTG